MKRTKKNRRHLERSHSIFSFRSWLKHSLTMPIQSATSIHDEAHFVSWICHIIVVLLLLLFFLEKRNWFSDECNSIFIAFEYFHHVNSVCWCSFLCSTEWLYISSFTTLAAALNPFNLINQFVWFAFVYSLIYHIWYCYYSLSPSSSSSTSLIIALLSHDMINIVWYVLSCNFRQLLLIPFSFHSFIIVSLETKRKLIHPMIEFSASHFIE